MSFNVGLSALRAATNDLNITGNNIANAGTVGFKQSRAEFGDLYAASVQGTGSNQQGAGVQLSNVAQLFNQGNINYTQNALDLAINGNGFFRTSNNGEVSYTRAGYFGVDRDGFMVNNFGQRLQGYAVDANNNLQNGVIADIRVQAGGQAPKASSTLTQAFNLNSTNAIPATTPFDPADPNTYNSATSTNIYDTQGNAHVMTQYFVKSGPNTWNMNVLIDGRNPADPTSTVPYSLSMGFTASGQLDPASLLSADFTVAPDGRFTLNGWVPAAADNSVPPIWSANGATESPTGLLVDLRNSTQFASSFAVNSVSQDGFTTGQLSGLEIDDTGVIFARYTNGQSAIQGQIVLATFANVQGLTPVGKSAWAQSFQSGEPVVGTPRSGTLGALQSGALEDSNVDVSEQLVAMIVAQRNYQAAAKTIETESTVTQTIINIR
jgi:flagellar hook protein FlgE